MTDSSQKILIVDDNPKNIQVLGTILGEKGYDIAVATSGEAALKMVDKTQPHIILLDVMMPGMDGFETCQILKSSDKTKDIPVLFLTAKTDIEDIVKGFDLGAVDYVTKPFQAAELLRRVATHLEIVDHRSNLEQKVQERTNEVQMTLQRLENSHFEIINRLGLAAEIRDNETGLHLTRISKYTQLIVHSLKMNEQEIKILVPASMMHDVGKIGIPDHILLKPGKYEPEEFEVMKSHTTIGARLLSGIDSELIVMAEKIALTHHEKWDGTGYPGQLKGEDIPFEGRIVAIADVFDALCSKRPYKEPWPFDKALDFIHNEAGKHFDPYLAEKFLENRKDIEKIMKEFREK
ncbi:MAG: two-component system response regulator [Leptospirales bacterium]